MVEENPIETATDPRVAELADLTELLESVPRLTSKRNRLVRELKASGMSAEDLAKIIGRSTQRVWQILEPPKSGAPHDGGDPRS